MEYRLPGLYNLSRNGTPTGPHPNSPTWSPPCRTARSGATRWTSRASLLTHFHFIIRPNWSLRIGGDGRGGGALALEGFVAEDTTFSQ